jgi:hypothetical protein
VTRRTESGGSVRSFVGRSERAHVTALARLSQASTIPLSNQRLAAIFCPGSPANTSLSQGWGRSSRKASLMQDHAKCDQSLKCTTEAVQTFFSSTICMTSHLASRLGYAAKGTCSEAGVMAVLMMFSMLWPEQPKFPLSGSSVSARSIVQGYPPVHCTTSTFVDFRPADSG